MRTDREMANQLRLITRLERISTPLKLAFPYLNVGMDELADDLRDYVADGVSPRTVTEVRNKLPKSCWIHGLFYIVMSKDTTLEDGEEDGFCTDWWTDALMDFPRELMMAMVKKGTVNSPDELLKWISQMYRALYGGPESDEVKEAVQ